jgi:hypothetical protein
VLILVSLLAYWAIKPIESAQEETLETLVGGETPAQTQPVEEAVEAGARI